MIASLMAAASPFAAAAQDTGAPALQDAGQVEQIADPAARAQPALPADDIVTFRDDAAPAIEASVRTEDSRQSVQAVRQLGPADDGRPVTQLYRGGRTAQPSAPLSSPAQGRTGAVEVVEGRDRCDPGAADAGAPTQCARVIEKRSAEFTKPAPTALSPEQKLLVEGRIRTDHLAPDRRLATRSDVDDPDYQQVAAAALQGAPASAGEKPAQEESETEAQAMQNAVVGGIVDMVQPR